MAASEWAAGRGALGRRLNAAHTLASCTQQSECQSSVQCARSDASWRLPTRPPILRLLLPLPLPLPLLPPHLFTLHLHSALSLHGASPSSASAPPSDQHNWATPPCHLMTDHRADRMNATEFPATGDGVGVAAAAASASGIQLPAQSPRLAYRASGVPKGPPPRRSSMLSDFSLDDAQHTIRSSTDSILLPRPSLEAPEHVEEPSHWHSAPLAFAILPAVAGLVFKNGNAFTTDVLLLGLAAIFLNWSVRLPW